MFGLMHDTRPHTARITLAYLDRVRIPLLPCPPRNTDLNPIEGAWDILRRCIQYIYVINDLEPKGNKSLKNVLP